MWAQCTQQSVCPAATALGPADDSRGLAVAAGYVPPDPLLQSQLCVTQTRTVEFCDEAWVLDSAFLSVYTKSSECTRHWDSPMGWPPSVLRGVRGARGSEVRKAGNRSPGGCRVWEPQEVLGLESLGVDPQIPRSQSLSCRFLFIFGSLFPPWPPCSSFLEYVT